MRQGLTSRPFLFMFMIMAFMFGNVAVIAQDEEKAEKAEEPAVYEEVVVTTTRRETPLAKTPIAVTAVDQEELTVLNITDMSTLNTLVPSLQIRDTGTDGQGSTEINMRGIGNSTYVETGEPNVALSVDGVYTARAQAVLQMFYDIERIEVARGPQGTLFGRNASVGSINVVTKRPDLDEYSGSLEGEFSNENGRALRAMGNVPVGDGLAFRLNYVKVERNSPYNLVRDDSVLPLGNQGIKPTYRDQYGDPLSTKPGSPGSRDNEAFRVSALWQPSDQFNWYVAYETYEDKAPGNPLSVVTSRIQADNYLDATQRVAVEADPWTGVNSDPSRMDMEIQNLRSVAEFESDAVAVKYTYGHSEFEQFLLQDLDGGVDIQIVFMDDKWKNKSDTHDLNFTSRHDGPVSWTAGYYYFEETTERKFGVDFPPFGYVAFFQPDIYAESSAFYGDMTVDIGDEFQVFGGARYTDDERGNRGGGSYGPFTGNPACANGGELGSTDFSVIFGDRDGDSTTGLYGLDCRYDDVSNEKSFDYTDWRFGVNWQINDRTMAYVSAATGHKSGLFDTQFTVQRTNELNSIPLEPEKNTSYEIGLKGSAMDGRFNYAVDYYLMDFENKQESSILSFGDRFCDLNGDGDADDPGEQEIGCGAGGGFVDLNDAVFADQNEFLVLNIEGLDVQGIEFEGSYRSDNNDILSGFFTWTDAEFNEYLASSPVMCAVRFGAGLPCPIENWEGNTPKNTPEFTLNATYSKIFVLDRGATITPTLNVYYRSEYHLTNENLEGVTAESLGLTSGETNLFDDSQDASTKVSLFLRYGTPKYDVELFATNLLDEDIYSHERTDTGGIPLYVYEPPREFGVRFRAHF